jgi:hypothetical protein
MRMRRRSGIVWPRAGPLGLGPVSATDRCPVRGAAGLPGFFGNSRAILETVRNRHRMPGSAEAIGDDGGMHGFSDNQRRGRQTPDHGLRILAGRDIVNTGQIAEFRPVVAIYRCLMRHENRPPATRKIAKFRKIRQHDRRIDDAFFRRLTKQRRRARPAQGLDPTFGQKGIVGHRTIASPRTNDQLGLAAWKPLIDQCPDTDQHHVRPGLAPSRQDFVPEPEIQIIAEISMGCVITIKLQNRSNLQKTREKCLPAETAKSLSDVRRPSCAELQEIPSPSAP